MQNSKLKYLFLSILITFALLQGSYCSARVLEVPGLPGITDQSTLPQYVVAIFSYIMGIGVTLAFLFLLIGVVQYMTSAGRTEAISNAKSRIKSAILGLFLMLSSTIILVTISPELKNIKIETLKPVPGTIKLIKGEEVRTFPTIMGDTSNIADYTISWPSTIDGQPNCLFDASGKQINATYVIYPYDEVGFKKIKAETKRIKCGESTSIYFASYTSAMEQPGVYFFPGADCGLIAPGSSEGSLPRFFGQITIDNWNGDRMNSIRIVNGDDPSKGPFYGMLIFKGVNQTTSETGVEDWQSLEPCGDFNCLGRTRESTCLGMGILEGSSFTIYPWVGYDSSGKVASAGSGIEMRTRPSWLGGRFLISDIDIRDKGYLQVEPGDYEPDYSGADVPDEEQDLCPDFGYQTSGDNHHCLNSLHILGNYIVLFSDSKEAGVVDADAQRFPISRALLKDTQGVYNGYDPANGPRDLTKDWYYNDCTLGKCNHEDWLTIIPLANKIP
ncbi:MAG: pilin [Candidatus Staskawiczbacteria bacterium]|jgi:hypothetical protein